MPDALNEIANWIATWIALNNHQHAGRSNWSGLRMGNSLCQSLPLNHCGTKIASFAIGASIFLTAIRLKTFSAPAYGRKNNPL